MPVENRLIQQAFVFALDATPRQQRAFASHAGGARFAYNWGIQKSLRRWMPARRRRPPVRRLPRRSLGISTCAACGPSGRTLHSGSTGRPVRSQSVCRGYPATLLAPTRRRLEMRQSRGKDSSTPVPGGSLAAGWGAPGLRKKAAAGSRSRSTVRS